MSRHDDPDVRPYFGELPEPVGHPAPSRPTRQPVAKPIEEWRRSRILEGLCPRPSCLTELDEDACPRCGWSLLEEQMTARLNRVEDRDDDWLPTLPQALTIDCYADANLDPEAYA